MIMILPVPLYIMCTYFRRFVPVKWELAISSVSLIQNGQTALRSFRRSKHKDCWKWKTRYAVLSLDAATFKTPPCQPSRLLFFHSQKRKIGWQHSQGRQDGREFFSHNASVMRPTFETEVLLEELSTNSHSKLRRLKHPLPTDGVPALPDMPLYIPFFHPESRKILLVPIKLVHRVKSCFQRIGSCHKLKQGTTDRPKGVNEDLVVTCEAVGARSQNRKPKIVQLHNAQAFSCSALPWNPVQSVNIQPGNVLRSIIHNYLYTYIHI